MCFLAQRVACSNFPTLDGFMAQIPVGDGRMPRQIPYIIGNEACERFSFYGMRGMLAVFMVSQLNMDETTANLQYGATQAWVYAFTFIGGLFADKILGLRKSLFWGGISGAAAIWKWRGATRALP